MYGEFVKTKNVTLLLGRLARSSAIAGSQSMYRSSMNTISIYKRVQAIYRYLVLIPVRDKVAGHCVTVQ